MDDPFYYVRGRGVHKRPIDLPNGASTLGFQVCQCSEYVDGAAKTIADALNRLPQLETMLRELLEPSAGLFPDLADKVRKLLTRG